jgi:hypothetical protein
MEITISIEELRKRKLFLAAPMYGGQCAGMFAKSVADLTSICTSHGVELRSYFLFNESLITRARNYCVDEFMRSGCTHMMFIDSDIGFDPKDVLGMLALQGDDTEYDVLAGPYPKKCISWEKIKLAVDKGIADEDPNILEKYVGDYVFNPKGNSGSIRIDVPVEVSEVGTGFMMTRRSAFEKFAESYPQYNYKPDHVRTEHFDGSREIMQYFQAEIDGLDYGAFFKSEMQKVKEMGINDPEILSKEIDAAMERAQEEAAKYSKRYLSEDYWFCRKLQDIGLKIWYCPWMKLQHVGSYIFGGSLVDLAQIGAPATADASLLKKPKK